MSEPQEEDDDCVDVGTAYVSIPDILHNGRNVFNEDIPSTFCVRIEPHLTLTLTVGSQFALCLLTVSLVDISVQQTAVAIKLPAV